MVRRSGLTLTEVLVTLAILSFGILAILTMFPLAASQMAIAVREDRSAQAANAADAYMRSYWKTQVVEPGGSTEPFFTALDNPNTDPTTGLPLPLSLGSLLGALTAGTSGSSSPVFVDPIGFAARPATSRGWMGDSGNLTNAPRRTLKPFLTDSQFAFRTCSLMDGMGFDDNGQPTPDREMRYNWMWVLQRPNNADKLTANMTVVVYDNRPNMFAPTGSEASFSTLGVGVVLPGSTSLNLALSGVTPDVKPGSWIVDVTDPLVEVSLLPLGSKVRHANFYQVVSTAPNGPSLSIELNTPLAPSGDLSLSVYIGKFIVLKGVTGVYQRAPLTH